MSATAAPSPVIVVTGSPVIWGAEISLLAIAELLHDDVPLRLMCANPQLAERWRAARLGPVAQVTPRAGRLSRAIGFLKPMLRGIPSRSTLLVFDFYLLPLVALLWPLLKLKRVRVVVDLHDSARRNPRRLPYFQLLRLADAVVCISDYLAAQVPPGPRVHVVHRPVGGPVPVAAAAPTAPAAETAGEEQPGILHVGLVGQITPDKGVADVIDWFLDAPENTVLHLRGAAPDDDGGFAARAIARATATLGPRFIHDGLVARDAAMAGLDVLVVANPDEPFGRTVIEAQLAGVIPLVPDAGGARELVDPAESGLHYRAGDGASFIAQLGALCADRELRARLRATAPTSAARLSDPRRIGRQYASALEGEAA
ncbi:glycosyltransferase family 4 protein [Gryllotalpicola koreensis]|uniref:Glycosyl transferase family 1 domain-containing protein n=1 Tax=Gryllotalpicola koreensis TaxID=993086 RepID=A0ABP8A0I2_9MICO